MEQTPRHLFIDEAFSHKAYDDTALPIGNSQTISQPFVVALMTELLLDSGDNTTPLRKVLEVGTGCGYQTAILAQLAQWVFTIERIGPLQQQSRQRLPGLGYRNISYLHGDGFKGWSANAPFDGVLVAAAPAVVPEELLQQLVVGGRLIVPVGNDDAQHLRMITRTRTGFEEQQRTAVKFVPMLNGRIN